jgi:hypothetical protein
VTTVLDVAFWTIPAAVVAALVIRNEHRIHTNRRK